MAFEEVGAGWIKETKNGHKYISIKLKAALDAGEYLSLWKNKEKRGEKSPDYRLTVSTKEAKPKAEEDGFTQERSDDDIPF